MNILEKYIKEENKRRYDYAYCLFNIYDYARLGELDQAQSSTEEQKNKFRQRAIEIRDEMAELIVKGMK